MGVCYECQISKCLLLYEGGKCEALTREKEERMREPTVDIKDPHDLTLGVQPMRTFDSGATRDSDDGKPDYEGFLSPLTLRRYGEYMNKHRKQADGKMRASDNWQNGIPIDTYMKSMLRHVMDLWLIQRYNKVVDERDGLAITRQEALCAILFNAFGFLHELEKTVPQAIIEVKDAI